MRDVGLENAKPSKLPGVKEEHKCSGGGPSGAGVYPLNAMDVEPPGAVDVDLYASLDKCASKGKGRGSVRESPGLGKNVDGARLALVRSGEGAASERVDAHGGTSVLAAPAEVGALLAAGVNGCREGPGVMAASAEVGAVLAAGVLGCPGPVRREVGLRAVDIQEEIDETPLSSADARVFRAVAARLNY